MISLHTYTLANSLLIYSKSTPSLRPTQILSSLLAHPPTKPQAQNLRMLEHIHPLEHRVHANGSEFVTLGSRKGTYTEA